MVSEQQAAHTAWKQRSLAFGMVSLANPSESGITMQKAKKTPPKINSNARVITEHIGLRSVHSIISVTVSGCVGSGGRLALGRAPCGRQDCPLRPLLVEGGQGLGRDGMGGTMGCGVEAAASSDAFVAFSDASAAGSGIFTAATDCTGVSTAPAPSAASISAGEISCQGPPLPASHALPAPKPSPQRPGSESGGISGSGAPP